MHGQISTYARCDCSQWRRMEGRRSAERKSREQMGFGWLRGQWRWVNSPNKLPKKGYSWGKKNRANPSSWTIKRAGLPGKSPGAGFSGTGSFKKETIKAKRLV